MTMKYITPEIFTSPTFSSNLEGLKKDLELLEAGKGTCPDSWRSRFNFYSAAGADQAKEEQGCSSNYDFYVVRRYYHYWDSVKKERVKNHRIYFYSYCDRHKPKKARKATQKELFYIKICSLSTN